MVVTPNDRSQATGCDEHAAETTLHATSQVSRTPARRSPHTAGGAPLVPAVTRALALLDRLALQREPMSLAKLTAELALPKSSVHGLCNTLMSFGYLRRQPDGSF